MSELANGILQKITLPSILRFDFRNSGVLRQRYDSLKYVVKRRGPLKWEIIYIYQTYILTIDTFTYSIYVCLIYIT